MQIKALPGYFEAFPTENASPIDSRQINPLRLTPTHDNWKHLYTSIPPNTNTHEYKLVLLARHGQGFHNAATDRYGVEAWNNHWCSLEGDEFGPWIDSRLTPLGQEQVENTGASILVPIVKDLDKIPDKFFSSPLRRCLETYIGSWGKVFANQPEAQESKVNVEIVELLREKFNGYTCNHRTDHSQVLSEYQDRKLTGSQWSVHWAYADGYPEKDTLWRPKLRESIQDIDGRLNRVLKQIFTNGTRSDDRFISITCHAHVIESILRITNHPAIDNLNTAKIVGIVVEITK